MKILAIDPGYEKVGWSVFETGKTPRSDFSYIASGLIKTTKMEHEIRLHKIFTSLEEIISQHVPKTMVIESLFFFKNKKTVLKVAQAIGVIELCAFQCGLSITRFTPLQIKETITGYGQADKNAVEKMIKLELGDKIAFSDDDEADAVACGLAYCFRASS